MVARLFIVYSRLAVMTSSDENLVHIDQELERELNVHCVERIGAEQREQLLSYQLQQLLVAMDVLLESQSSSDGLDCPREFSNDTVLARVVRGRSRSRPYKFLSKPGIFTHRL
ncbi:THO complex subunit 5 homolog [Ixodes scapularis]